MALLAGCETESDTRGNAAPTTAAAATDHRVRPRSAVARPSARSRWDRQVRGRPRLHRRVRAAPPSDDAVLPATFDRPRCGPTREATRLWFTRRWWSPLRRALWAR